MHYRKIWEEFHKTKIPENYEIHHIDGNRKNNDPSNLICVSIEQHLDIHKNQNDWAAVQAIILRMNNKDGIAEAASKAQKKRLEEGKHNFQKISKEHRSLISKKTINQRINKHGVAFLGIENVKENSKRAGKVAAEKQAGFLNTKSHKHGSNYVKGTCWWTNVETGEKIRRTEAPSDKWKRGMLK